MLATFLQAGCASPAGTAPTFVAVTVSPATQAPPSATSATTPAASTPAAATPQASAARSASPEVSPNPVGFAFAAEDVLAYYAGVSYACSDGRPSTEAVGYMVRTCERVNPTGRMLTAGFVTGPDGALGNAFASVRASESEDVLDPIAALDPLSGFMGAMLGSDRGGAQVEWLAAHIGDVFAETSDGGLRIATYTASEQDHSVIYVELANQAYLAAPRPSGP